MHSVLLETNRFLFIMIAFAIIQSPLQKAMHLPHVNKPALSFWGHVNYSRSKLFLAVESRECIFHLPNYLFFLSLPCVWHSGNDRYCTQKKVHSVSLSLCNDILFEEKKLNILYVTAVKERLFKLVNHPSILVFGSNNCWQWKHFSI